MILTPIDGKIHIRADHSGKQVAVYDPATNALEIRQNSETVSIPLEKLLSIGKAFGAVRVSVSNGVSGNGEGGPLDTSIIEAVK